VQPRIAHTATMLLSGKVLIAGGGRGGMPGGYIAYDTAEIYDPASRKFSPVSAHMINDRVGAASVLLRDGRVLIISGKSARMLTTGLRGNLASLTPLRSAEIYDPESGAFVRTGRMNTAHYLGTATMLENGQVLVVGGYLIQGPTVVGMRDAEIYQPEQSQFVQVSPTNVARLENTATMLADGEVLIAGGIDGNSNISASVEFYSPRTHRFQMMPEQVAHASANTSE
jgi:hypothetical protein